VPWKLKQARKLLNHVALSVAGDKWKGRGLEPVTLSQKKKEFFFESGKYRTKVVSLVVKPIEAEWASGCGS
jgi:hypothetical protein